MISPLAIIQARLNSTRLPRKMLLTLGGETLIERGHRIAVEAFGAEHVLVAIPAGDEPGPLGDELRRIGASIFSWEGPESDVLSRMYHAAHSRRWHPDSVIVRITAEDPFKDPAAMRRVAAGERLPVEIGGEAFTLGMLDAAMERLSGALPPDPDRPVCVPVVREFVREHITYALFVNDPPPPPPGCWTVDTAEDLTQARSAIGRSHAQG